MVRDAGLRDTTLAYPARLGPVRSSEVEARDAIAVAGKAEEASTRRPRALAEAKRKGQGEY